MRHEEKLYRKKVFFLAVQNVRCFRTCPYRYRAAVLMDDHKESEAIDELSRAISFKPDLQLLHLRATFYDSMGEGAAAIKDCKDCEAALCIDPGHADIIELYQKAQTVILVLVDKSLIFFPPGMLLHCFTSAKTETEQIKQGLV